MSADSQKCTELSRRKQRGIITSNRPFKDWNQVFYNAK